MTVQPKGNEGKCGFCGKPLMQDEFGKWSDCSGYELRYAVYD